MIAGDLLGEGARLTPDGTALVYVPTGGRFTGQEEWGYTGSACVPMALHDARQKAKIRPGDRVVLVGSGVGYNQAAVAFRALRGLEAAAGPPCIRERAEPGVEHPRSG